MTGHSRIYPDEPAGPFPAPPESFEDGEGRPIGIRIYEPGDREAVVGMYRAFDPEDRAQGIPPYGERRIREWLDDVLRGDCHNIIARHDGDAVGHATLVPDGDGAHELAIFVLQAYQGAGIGTRLLSALLGHGAAEGVEKVWLTVERWNRPAVSLYETLGFETSDAGTFELEMSLRLH